MASIYNADFVRRLSTGVELVKHRWSMPPDASVRLLTLSENATFLVTDRVKQTRIIVRVHRPNYHSYDEITSEIAWIQALREESKVRIPAPLPLEDASYIASFDDQGEKRYAVAFEFILGKEPSTEDAITMGFEWLGQISAELHKHASQWTVPEGFTRKSWTFDTAFGDSPLWGDWRQAIDLEADDQEVLETLCNALESKLNDYGKQADRFGLIHADLRLANLLMDKNSLSVIDFDDCGFSWFMYDFAAAISFYEDSPHIPELMAAWLKGYQRVRPLAQEHQAMIPTFILFRRMLLTAWIASHAETDTAIEAGLGAYTKGTTELAKQYLQGRYLPPKMAPKILQDKH